MAILVILGHPHPGSFCQAIAQTAVDTLREQGREVLFHDLYREQFDPLLPYGEIAKSAPLPPIIQQHCAEAAQAEGIIIVHPNWWGQPPAILKGWVDRVLRAGVGYEFVEGDAGAGVPVGRLKAETALVFNTSNTPLDRELAVFGDPLETLWKNCIFNLCGVPRFYRKTFGVIVTSSLEERRVWLREAEEIIDKYFPSVNSPSPLSIE
jgi:NAD(P)H dehydrogenase (quinone)